MKNYFKLKAPSLIEDHHEAFYLWRSKGFKNVDLVHLDAHIDFGYYCAKPKEQAVKEARSLIELKKGLERSLLYQRYEKDFNKQVSIGNYIYPAMAEGIVRNFYWVIPGNLKEFKQSKEVIKKIFSAIKNGDLRHKKNGLQTIEELEDGVITAQLLDRRFIVCVLEKIPILKQKVLLDIDVDFMVTNNLLEAENTHKIGERKPWITPLELAKELIFTKKINPLFTTIAYSVNGGYTPMRYKALGDELAFCLSTSRFNDRYRKNLNASMFFERFQSTGKKEYYQKAVRLNPSYKAEDNNYGPLYLSMRKFSKARKEFLKIVRVDPENPYPFLGLGKLALEKKDFHGAKTNFVRVLKIKKDLPFALFGIGQAEFRLKRFKKAKTMFIRYKSLYPLQPQSYYYLGRIYERENDFKKAVAYYKDALNLGFNDISLLLRLLRISYHTGDRRDIIKRVQAKYFDLKNWLDKVQKTNYNGEAEKLEGIRKEIASLWRKLKKED